MSERKSEIPMNFSPLLIVTTAVLICSFLSSCNKNSEPDEYANHMDHLLSFSNKGLVLSNYNTESAPTRGFADFTGDGIDDMYEIRKLDFTKTKFELWLFEGEINPETKLVTFLDPYAIDIKDQKRRFAPASFKNNPKPVSEIVNKKTPELKWGSALKIDTADVNGDGYADIIFSEFSENWGADDFKLVVALNRATGAVSKKISFRWMTNIYDKKKKGDLTTTFLVFLKEIETEKDHYCPGSECSTRDFFTINWQDMDGNGTDDLVFFWRESRENLFVEVFYSNAPVPAEIFERLTISFHDDYLFSNIFNDDYRTHVNLTDITINDFNGDGRGDIVLIREKSGARVFLKFALNTSGIRRYDGLSFMTEFTTEYPEGDWSLIDGGLNKIEMFDINADGCVDYTHIGKSSYYPFGPKGKEIKNARTLYYMLTDCEKTKMQISKLKYSQDLIGIQWPDGDIPKAGEQVMRVMDTNNQ